MNFNKVVGNVGISLNTDRLDRNIREAQKKLNMQVVADCDPLIPFQQGGLRGSQRYPEGIYGGEISWDTPYAHYQHEGELYVDPKYKIGAFHDPVSGRYWSRKGIKKVPSGKKLNYHGGSLRGDHFIERMLADHFENILNAGQKEIDK